MRRVLLVAALAALPGACRSGGDAAGSPPPLAIGAAALDLGETDALERQLEPVFADGADADPGERFWSGWMLAQARGLRALGDPLQGRESPSSWTRHVVGALYFAQASVAEEGVARGQSPTLGERGPGVEDAARGLDLLRVAWLSELGFADRSGWILDQLPGLDGAEGLSQLLSRAGLHERLEPRAWLGVFRDRARRDPAGAFSFAVGALMASDRSPGTLGAGEVRSVEAWIEDGAPYVFRCPDCGQAAIPQLRACPNDQTRLERFEPSPRP